MTMQHYTQNGRSGGHGRRAVWGGGALLVGLAALLFCGGCPGMGDPAAQGLPDDLPTVVLSAEQVAGPGGILLYHGEEITGQVTVPENAILGAVKDGEVYLYHPALGDDELSEYNSRQLATACSHNSPLGA